MKYCSAGLSALFCFFLCNHCAFAQGLDKEAQIALQKRIYTAAFHYNDPSEAKGAAYALLALGDSTFKDSLLNIYFSNEAYASAVILGRELLEKRPDDLILLEITATAEQQLGAGMESLVHFSSLYRKTKNVYFLYQAATLQYQMKRIDEAKRSIEEMLTKPEATSTTVYISYGQNNGQEVPVKAAALNLKGAIFADENNDPIAIMAFNDAVAAFKDFTLAKENLRSLNVKIQQQAAENAKKE